MFKYSSFLNYYVIWEVAMLVRKGILGILIGIGILAVGFQSTVLGDPNDPEIVDAVGDTSLILLDIEAAWFYEKESEPEYLFTGMKINYLKEYYNAVFSIRWTFGDNDYVSGLNTYFQRSKVFRCGLPYQGRYWQWNRMPECEGTVDIENDVITWKILKSTIGHPQPGDVLTNTRAHAVPGFPISFIYFLMQHDFRDFAPDNPVEYGREYIIQY
jgi:hypothetical protein